MVGALLALEVGLISGEETATASQQEEVGGLCEGYLTPGNPLTYPSTTQGLFFNPHLSGSVPFSVRTEWALSQRYMVKTQSYTCSLLLCNLVDYLKNRAPGWERVRSTSVEVQWMLF